MKLRDVLMWLILGFIAMGILLHARQFSIANGSVFQGFNLLGKTLEGR
jgi:hypothetical protein